MRKKILVLICIVSLFILAFPLQVCAWGGFLVVNGDTLYHTLFCSEVEGFYLEDMLWFDTSRQAEQAGYDPCPKCDASNGDNFSCDNATIWKSDDNKVTAALEMERFFAIVEAYEAGKQDGTSVPDDYVYGSGNEAFDTGYDSGYEKGYDLGYNDGKNYASSIYNEQCDKQTKDATNDARIETAAICAIIFGVILFYARHKKES